MDLVKDKYAKIHLNARLDYAAHYYKIKKTKLSKDALILIDFHNFTF